MKRGPQTVNDLFNSCHMKRGYATEADAQQKGVAVYHCQVCGNWHRSTIKKKQSRTARFRHFIKKWETYAKRRKNTQHEQV